MLQQLIVLSCLIALSQAAVGFYPVKLGGKFKLSGFQVSEWSRTLRSGDVETINYCSPGENQPNCNKWINSKTDAVNNDSDSEVLSDGTLIIKNFKKSDVGSYYSDQIKPEITVQDDGSIIGKAAPLFNAILEDDIST